MAAIKVFTVLRARHGHGWAYPTTSTAVMREPYESPRLAGPILDVCRSAGRGHVPRSWAWSRAVELRMVTSR